MRKPRTPNRTDAQKMEDTFADLTLTEQAQMLASLQSLNRWCIRERSRAPQTGNEAEAAGRADHAKAANGALPLEHES